jgi:hypothetical protein
VEDDSLQRRRAARRGQHSHYGGANQALQNSANPARDQAQPANSRIPDVGVMRAQRTTHVVTLKSNRTRARVGRLNSGGGVTTGNHATPFAFSTGDPSNSDFARPPFRGANAPHCNFPEVVSPTELAVPIL